MRLMGIEATLAAGGSQIKAGETDTGTSDMRGRIEMDTGVADMREEIETETNEMAPADSMTTMDSRENSATIRGGGTTEEIDAMSHAGDTTMETAGMTDGDDVSKEGLKETAEMIRVDGMREGDMARHLIHDLGDVSMFPSMKDNVEARRVKPSKGKALVRSQSIKITFEGDMATTPIRVAATKSARGSTSRKTDTDYVMAEKDGQRIDGEEVILSPRKREVKKFLMKSSLDDIDTVAPKADAPTVAVSEVTARADCMATILLDGMEAVPPDKFYILGSGAVEAILNDGAVLDAVIENDSEAVIIDEDLAKQFGLGLDRSYIFEIEIADGRKQQITGVCHKAAIEVQGVRVTLPVFAVKNSSFDLLLGRTWLSHVHAVTIERPDGSQTLSIKKLDGTRVMIETMEPRDPRNRAALALGAGPSDRIKSLPISGRAVRFREKKYGPLLTEEEGQIVEMKDLGRRLIVDGNSYPKEADEEFGGVVSVSFLRAQPPMGGYPSDTSE
ncbi:hypothetical protein CBR_g19709 [Chara braunii]|uniref:Uncharacterized protein n=1 Tax=Chara braunii TaxID=69332 RepID=A0A388KYQ8_CHABU|nr:hypothetical protein CBR_g19709 [Chara braunii]|eukprot:GBG75196.1 hypothetical protein CBR_g19709 [Chara braunii]